MGYDRILMCVPPLPSCGMLFPVGFTGPLTPRRPFFLKPVPSGVPNGFPFVPIPIDVPTQAKPPVSLFPASDSYVNCRNADLPDPSMIISRAGHWTPFYSCSALAPLDTFPCPPFFCEAALPELSRSSSVFLPSFSFFVRVGDFLTPSPGFFPHRSGDIGQVPTDLLDPHLPKTFPLSHPLVQPPPPSIGLVPPWFFFPPIVVSPFVYLSFRWGDSAEKFFFLGFPG